MGLRLYGDAALLLSDGRCVVLERRAAALLALVALQPHISRSQVSRLLWPDAPNPRHNLRQQLLRFKQQWGHSPIEGDELLSLCATVRLQAPADQPLLADHAYDDCDDFARWLEEQRSRWQAQQVAEIESALAQAEAQGELLQARDLAERLVATDPGAEAHHRALMRVHYLRDDTAAGLAAYRRLSAQLAQEMGAQPSAATEQLAHALRQAAPKAIPQLRVIAPTLLRPPRTIGARDRLQSIHQALAAGQVVLLLGEAGLGKSRLLAEALRCGRQAGVSARPGDAQVPYATLARLLRHLMARSQALALPAPANPALERLLPELRHSETALPLPVDGARLLLQESVQSLLTAAQVEEVAVDDLHFADAASLELLQALLLAEPLQPIRWLLAQRPAQGDAALDALREGLLECGRLHTLTLTPLDVGQVGQLLHSLALPGLQTQTWAPRLHRHTGGNPLFVLETLKQMRSLDDAELKLPASSTVGALIQRRLKSLSPDALALARLAAIAGPDFSPTLAEAVTGRHALAQADAWAELEAAQVLRGAAFAHDLVLETTLSGLTQPIAQHLHAAVARHLQQHGGEPARLAAHWLAAQQHAAALPWLLQAADRARDAMRRREEAEFIERAAAITATMPLAAGPSAVDLYLRAYLTRECVDAVAPSLPLLDQALAVAGSAAERTRVLATRASGRIKMYELAGAVADFRAALAQAATLNDERLQLDIVSDLGAALSMHDRHEEAVALLAEHWPRVAQLDNPPGSWFSQHAMVLDNAGRPQEALPLHEQALNIARARGEHSEAIILCANMAISCIDVGELRRADSLLQQGEQLRLQHDALGGTNVNSWDLQAQVHRELGRYTRSLQASALALTHDRAQRQARLPMNQLHRAWTWQAMGQWSRALQDLMPDEAYAEVPGWVLARSWQLRDRIARGLGLPAGDFLKRADASLQPAMLRTMRDSVALDTALAQAQNERAEALREAAQADGFHGLRWHAEWVCAQLALAAGNHPGARHHATACLQRPAHHAPIDLALGSWWHGLWVIWLALGEVDQAQAARAEGLAWIHRCLQHELAPEFHGAFREAVSAHRALLLGSRLPA